MAEIGRRECVKGALAFVAGAPLAGAILEQRPGTGRGFQLALHLQADQSERCTLARQIGVNHVITDVRDALGSRYLDALSGIDANGRPAAWRRAHERVRPPGLAEAGPHRVGHGQRREDVGQHRALPEGDRPRRREGQGQASRPPRRPARLPLARDRPDPHERRELQACDAHRAQSRQRRDVLPGELQGHGRGRVRPRRRVVPRGEGLLRALPRFGTVDPVELLRGALAVVRPQADRLGTRIECAAESDVPQCRGGPRPRPRRSRRS